MAVGSSLTSLLRTTVPLLLLFAAGTRAYKRSLSDDLAELLPSCAQECFRSYIDVNYDGLDCGAIDSLQCACATKGTSGFTLGEGAVQCLVGAANVGLCTGMDADKTRLNLSYNMCKNEPDAVLPTHTVIQATLRLDESSRLVVSPPSETPAHTAEPSSPATTTTVDPRSTQDPQTSSSKPVLLPVPTGVASSPSDLEPETEENDQSRSTLTTSQIAGLAAGLGAALGIALVAICLARRRRRKLDGDVETGFFLSSEKFKAISSRFSRAPPMAHSISAPLGGSGPPVFPMGPHGPASGLSGTSLAPPQPANVPSAAAPMAMAAANTRPSGSQPRNANRPVLSLAIPRNNTSPVRLVPGRTSTGNNPPADHQPPQAGGNPTIKIVRESTHGNANASGNNDNDNDNDSPMTEFEEDDRNSPVQVWRPPSAVPQSATTMYVADKWGNWVLADERRRKRISIAELEGTTPLKPVQAPGPVLGVTEDAGAARATELVNQAAGAGLRPPAEIYRQGEAGRGGMASNASSMYSTDTRGWSTAAAAAPPVPSNPMMPRPLAARQGSRSYSRPLNSNSARSTAYSPALNPFLDENGISPVRNGGNGQGQRRPGAPGLLITTPGSGPESTFQVPIPRVRSPPGQPSPTLSSPHRDLKAPRPGAYASVPSPSRTQTQSPPRPRRESQSRPQYAYPQPPAPLHIPEKPSRSSAGTPSEDSPSSSLLAKRLGPQRAAGLALRPEGLVTPQQPSGRAPAPGPSSGRGAEEAPISPIWKPLLTPERRGDDLFISLHLT